MKTVIYFILTLLLCSCGKTDNFYDLERFFTTDKEVYKVGDSIFITINLVPEKQLKEINLYKNLKNIEIGTIFHKEYKLQNGDTTFFATQNGIKENVKLKNDTVIESIKISKQEPYKKTLRGYISEDEKNFIIEFPDYGLKSIIDKEEYKKSLDFGFTGHCMPIYGEFGASYEEFIDFKSIKIKS